MLYLLCWGKMMLWPVLGMSPAHTMSAEILRDGLEKGEGNANRRLFARN
jgi:hypothetical protein